DERFPGQLEVQASILRTVGDTYRGIGEPGKAEEFLTRTVDIYRGLFGDDHLETLDALLTLARTHQSAGNLTRAIALCEQVRESLLKQLPADALPVLITEDNLGLAYQGMRRTTEAIALLEKVRDARVRQFGADSID